MRHVLKTALLTILLLSSGLLSSTSFAGDSARHYSGHRYLANPVEDLKDDYDYFIVGSGFGVSPIALRLAQAGKRVVIFERGPQRLPGTFPTTAAGLFMDLRGDSNPLGFVDLHSNALKADADVIGANALGGTSNLYGGITMRADKDVLLRKEFSQGFRDDVASGAFDEDYKRAGEMLLPNYGPRTEELPKVKTHWAALPLATKKIELPLAINHQEGRERFGVTQHACTNCGNCCGGCNVGAKNVLTANYLACAKDAGAEIYTQMEIEYLERMPPGSAKRWKIHYKRHYKGANGILQTEHATRLENNVILGAGSAGTTEILLRSQKYGGLKLSKTLGLRFSANGDVLGFIYNSGVYTAVVASEDSSALTQADPQVGQTLTVAGVVGEGTPIDGRGLVLDGAIPTALASLTAQSLATANLAPSLLRFSLKDKARIGLDLTSLLGYPAKSGALNHSFLLLRCGHDTSGGRYVLDDQDRAYVEWHGVQQEAWYQNANQFLAAMAKKVGGVYIPNPRSRLFGGNKIQATHPLGGCPEGDSVEDGVVNHLGQVFNPDGGVYEGLFVSDASTVSRSLGVPPSMTIAGRAERVARWILGILNGCKEVLSSGQR